MVELVASGCIIGALYCMVVAPCAKRGRRAGVVGDSVGYGWGSSECLGRPNTEETGQKRVLGKETRERDMCIACTYNVCHCAFDRGTPQ